MTVAYLNPGSTTLVDAAWSDAAGFSTANAELVIQDNASSITAGLDQTGNPIDYLHIRGGGPRITGLFSIEYRETSTLDPAFLWNAAGSATISFVGSYGVDEMVLAGGANLTFSAGTLDGYLRILGGTVSFGAAFNFGAGSQIIMDGGSLNIAASSGSNVIPLVTQNGGSIVCNRGVTTITRNGGTMTYDSATVPTTHNNNGGVFRGVQSIGTTVNSNRGTVDPTALKRPATVTTWNVLGSALPPENSLLTVTTTNVFGLKYAVPAQTGQPLT
jgi:hypothetical protein